jgi:hypothetical protein
MGKVEGGSFYWEEGSEAERFCLWELCEGNLRRGSSLNGDPEGYVKGRFGHLPPRGPFWEPVGGSFAGDFEKQ